MTMPLTRRAALAALFAGTASACAPTPKGVRFIAPDNLASGRFAHGIASGDPMRDRVIIWTRVSPDDASAPLNINWQIASAPNDGAVIKSGDFETGPFRDFTVKVDAGGLSPGQTYYYRFQSGPESSPWGRTQTLPEGALDSLHLAVVSCANWQAGYFNPYDHIARMDDEEPFDALLHLGDYFYEYGTDKANKAMIEAGRLHDPAHEIVSLADYRARHRQYRTDAALQAVTAKMAMIAIWDDHESANDSWSGGAENHQPGEGSWETRKQAALRAYYEWMPVRDPAPGLPLAHLYRSFSWGDLATITAIETRLLARGAPIIIDDYYAMLREPGGPERFKAEVLEAPGRQMLGAQQTDFITDGFARSKAAGQPWRILANQVVMGKVITPDLRPYVDEASMAAIEKEWGGIRGFVELSGYGLPVYPDSWDGYPAARQSFYDALKDKGITDMLVLTGDAHEYWANDLTADDGTKMGVELGTSSVSSETLAAFLGEAAPDYALLMTRSNQDVRYYNPLHQGYIDLKLDRHKARAKLIAVNTVAQRNYEAFTAARFSVRKSGGSLKLTRPKGLNLKQRALFSSLG